MKYAVQVNYRTHRGNASSRTFVVEANNEPEAVEIANGKARKHPNVQSIVGGDVVEVFSPAPTDWGKELDGIKKTTLAAYQFIKQSIINSSDMPYDMREIELADAVGVYTHVCLRWWPSEATGELRAYLKNRFREKESVWSCDAARIVEIAESVQKAIAGGTGK